MLAKLEYKSCSGVWASMQDDDGKSVLRVVAKGNSSVYQFILMSEGDFVCLYSN